MARKASWPPKLLRKPGTNQARTYWGGGWHGCGLWDVAADRPTPAAVAKHARLLQEWAACPAAASLRADDLLLAELWAAWRDAGGWDEARRKEYESVERHLFGTPDEPGPHLDTAAAEFGSKALAAWQMHLCRLERGGRRRYSKYTVLRRVGIVKEMFRWGAVQEAVTELACAALDRVPPPRPEDVRQPAERRFVTAEQVAAFCGRSQSDAGGLVRFLWWTGCRPSEAIGLTAEMVVRSGAVRTAKGGAVDLDAAGVWAAPLAAHKTARKGKERCLFFGPEARQILEPRLARGGVLFRTSYGRPWTPMTFNRALAKRQRRTGQDRWPPYALRHACADRVTRDPRGGFEAAAAYLGHSPGGVTARYTGVLWQKAAEVAAVLG